MKKSIIKDLKLQPDMLYDMYVFNISFENGDIGKVYKKKNSIYQNIGDEVEYTINDKGSVKFPFKGDSKFDNKSSSNTTSAKYTNNDIDTQDRIRHAQATNMANLRYCYGKIEESQIEEIIKAEYYKLKNFKGYEQTEVELKTKVEADLPF
tara:strand:- start:950 stop:1402 length:453 start_codon:yes stop_codon:yes gene_type:complete